MLVNYTADAFGSLVQLINYIESLNTKGAGLRWLDRYELFLQNSLSRPRHIKLCHNGSFHRLKLRCIYFNEWVIAFSVNERDILIEAVLHRSRLTN